VLSEHELLARFHDYGQIHGGELYLASTAAHDFVAACQENEIAVVGIEGFKVSGDKRLPLLDGIADYSARIIHESQTRSWDSLHNVL
jgi:hypothetical protein